MRSAVTVVCDIPRSSDRFRTLQHVRTDIVDAAHGSPLIAVPELTFNALLSRTWQLLGGLGSGDAIGCQSNEGIHFFGISLFARIG